MREFCHWYVRLSLSKSRIEIVLFRRPSVPSSTGSSKRYYFEHLQLNSTQLKVSVSSAGRLPEDLQSLKSSLGLILVNLEDATVDLGGYKVTNKLVRVWGDDRGAWTVKG